MTTGIHIELGPSTDYRRAAYGIVLESVTVHTISGPGVHNRHHAHKIEVWENRPSKVAGADPDQLVDPHGQPTEAPYTVITAAQASVISAHPIARDPYGAALAIGDVVVLTLHGYRIGIYTITAGRLADPHLVPVAAVI